MATLRLEPDEILPDMAAPVEGEASEPFSIFWRGKERQFVFRVVEFRRGNHVVFAHEVDNEAAGNWLIYERETVMPVSWPSAPPRKQLDNMPLEFAARDWDFGRFFTTDIKQNCSFRVLLLGADAGAWLDVDRRFRMSAAFNFTLSPEVFESDRNGTWQFCKREMADFDSAIGFAARWAACGGERNDLVFGEHKAEIWQVMEWVLRCEPRLWERGNDWDWKLGGRTTDFSYLFCPEADNIEDFAVNLPFIYAIGRFLVEEHIPKITKLVRERHRSVRKFFNSELVWIRYFTGKPTAHEQLEAALKLRDWLHKNDAPAELLALLPR